ncbi:hypothetical protein [Streptomyces sp. NBC_00258]|nr:hypothetical protein [Streptomyces sp. NBC_00258]
MGAQLVDHAVLHGGQRGQSSYDGCGDEQQPVGPSAHAITEVNGPP